MKLPVPLSGPSLTFRKLSSIMPVDCHPIKDDDTQPYRDWSQPKARVGVNILFARPIFSTRDEEIDGFQSIVGGFIEMVDGLAQEVEKEKMKAIGSRNLLKSIAKQREAQQQQLQALIAEKKTQLERYRIQTAALQKEEAEQNEFIEQFILQK
ncbi:intraflagellar transport protein 20 homolog isoform X1 [Asterias rubens]|uniref:intraflagellar transport protein 20 homolog isoform X1 n=1 Tax=Asterias rubens TaxID=7604 RepID=UPI0014550F6D|nr:intraflagellar transport protein 20 homolog isoform X1 [Asterias rubens]